jgi:hypothetical protein
MTKSLFPFGYGRAWSEPKATGIRRILQIGREPMTKKSLTYTAVFYVVAVVAGLLLFAP